MADSFTFHFIPLILFISSLTFVTRVSLSAKWFSAGIYENYSHWVYLSVMVYAPGSELGLFL